jgi:hypothetical protein
MVRAQSSRGKEQRLDHLQVPHPQLAGGAPNFLILSFRENSTQRLPRNRATSTVRHEGALPFRFCFMKGWVLLLFDFFDSLDPRG